MERITLGGIDFEVGDLVETYFIDTARENPVIEPSYHEIILAVREVPDDVKARLYVRRRRAIEYKTWVVTDFTKALQHKIYWWRWSQSLDDPFEVGFPRHRLLCSSYD